MYCWGGCRGKSAFCVAGLDRVGAPAGPADSSPPPPLTMGCTPSEHTRGGHKAAEVNTSPPPLSSLALAPVWWLQLNRLPPGSFLCEGGGGQGAPVPSCRGGTSSSFCSAARRPSVVFEQVSQARYESPPFRRGGQGVWGALSIHSWLHHWRMNLSLPLGIMGGGSPDPNALAGGSPCVAALCHEWLSCSLAPRQPPERLHVPAS